ncbi:LysR family transcriptional regulator [Kitasatospora fiedleri]|uniref:LysR family transcriptional regulator n=1 Tax=Kitasatospora fiedleri TaxID=2991545 RepID=UPI000C2C8D60|nr:LysR family transcriptional regulator [Kitasatospora fiedleri]
MKVSLRDIEVKLLRALVAIVDEGGFACAARSLHVTQPTISQQIQRLESIVQAPLFERTRRPLLLTPVGREVLAHARRVILLNNEVLGRISTLGSLDSLSLGCSVHFADGLRTMLSELAAERPQLKCSIATGLSAALADRVAQGELEAAILLGIETPRCEMLGRLRVAWYGPDSLPPEEPVPVALVSERSALSRRIIETLAEHNVPWRSAPWCSDPLAVRASVRAGLAYTVLTANVHHTDPSLRPVPSGTLCPDPEPLPVYLAFSPSAREPVIGAARSAARAALRDVPLGPP